MLGSTKGTALEQSIQQMFEAEIRGVGMYQGLALLAENQGAREVATVLRQLAEDEARHAGLYALLNGQVAAEWLPVLEKVAQLETAAVQRIEAIAAELEAAGLSAAAAAVRAAAADEGRHGEILAELVAKQQAK